MIYESIFAFCIKSLEILLLNNYPVHLSEKILKIEILLSNAEVCQQSVCILQFVMVIKT